MTFSNELQILSQIVPFYICHKWHFHFHFTHPSFLSSFGNQNLSFTSFLCIWFSLEIEGFLPPFFFLISIPGGILERYECCILSRLVYRMQIREMILIWRCVLSFLISFSEIRTKKNQPLSFTKFLQDTFALELTGGFC